MQHSAPAKPFHGTLTLTSTNNRTLANSSVGCQMNVSDSEVLLGVLKQAGYSQVSDASVADVVLINTCAIRDNAEQKVCVRRA
jgi:tRNA-2-methylthio-N6-dimethylallyladenosine synthase